MTPEQHFSHQGHNGALIMTSKEILVELQHIVEDISPWATLSSAASLPTQSLMHKQEESTFPSTLRQSRMALENRICNMVFFFPFVAVINKVNGCPFSATSDIAFEPVG